MAKKSEAGNSQAKFVCQNRKARHNYEILDELECGVALTGSEVKSIRNGKITIDEAYARVRDGELWLLNCDIAEYPQATVMNHVSRRARKLLLHKRELRKFAEAADHEGLTMIPLSVHFSRGVVKVTIAVARGRKLHDKREKLKKQSAAKEMRNATMKRR